MSAYFLSVTYRTLLRRVGGEERRGLKPWFDLIARRSGVSFRVVRGAYYGERLSPAAERKLEEAARRHDYDNYAVRCEYLAESLCRKDAEFFSEEADRLRALAQRMRGLDRR